jgi:hypothetical protein
MEGWGRRFDPVGIFVRVSIKLPLSRLVLLLNLELECPTLQLFRRWLPMICSGRSSKVWAGQGGVPAICR